MQNDNLKSFQTKKRLFFPYEGKVKTAYFAYLGLCSILFLAVFIFCLFATINVAKYKLYNLPLVGVQYHILNLWYSPIICLIAVIISMVLLLIAPKISTISAKCSSRMFYWSFWLLIISVMLSSVIQLTYISQSDIFDSPNYNWMNPILVRVFILISIMLIIFVQIFFWIMRRKFTFMPSDYEIYTNRMMMKKNLKEQKQAKKILKK